MSRNNSTLRSMDMMRLEGQGFIPAYTRTDLTNELHETFGFRTDYEILTPSAMRKICSDTEKQKKRTIVNMKKVLETRIYTGLKGLFYFFNCQKQDYILQYTIIQKRYFLCFL